jgi:hypothetical protein
LDFVIIKDADYMPGGQDDVRGFNRLQHIACMPATTYEDDWDRTSGTHLNSLPETE